MIPNPRRDLVARWDILTKDGKTTLREVPVVAFDDHGHPFVSQSPEGDMLNDLTRADTFEHYTGIDINPDAGGYYELISGSGWVVEYRNDDGTTSETRVVAWASTSLGLNPLIVDDRGKVRTVTDQEHVVRVYHADDDRQKG